MAPFQFKTPEDEAAFERALDHYEQLTKDEASGTVTPVPFNPPPYIPLPTAPGDVVATFIKK